jgi:hypothetical protein
VPTPDQLDLDGLDTNTEDVAASLAVDTEEWQAEVALIEEWFAQIGDSLPNTMRDALRRRLSTATGQVAAPTRPGPERRADGFAAPEQDNGAEPCISMAAVGLLPAATGRKQLSSPDRRRDCAHTT